MGGLDEADVQRRIHGTQVAPEVIERVEVGLHRSRRLVGGAQMAPKAGRRLVEGQVDREGRIGDDTASPQRAGVHFVVALAQSAEHRIVAPKVTGSSPVGHPTPTPTPPVCVRVNDP